MFILFSVVLFGFISISIQILLLRELLIINYGNELSIGITLSIWLFSTGIGSFVFSKFVNKIKNKINFFIVQQILLAIILIFTIIFIRFIPKIFNIIIGEITSPQTTFFSCFAAIFPSTFILGSIFVSATGIYKEIKETPVSAGYVYLYESIGAVLGGIFTSIFFVKISNIFLLIIFFSFLLTVCVIVNIFYFNLRKTSKLNFLQNSIISNRLKNFSVFSEFSILLLVFLILFGFILNSDINKYLVDIQWYPYKIIETQNSKYQNITVSKIDNQTNFFSNGLFNFSLEDKFTQEFIVHISLLEHPFPKEILIVGNATKGVIREILKHNIKRLDYVEMDSLLIDMLEKYEGKFTFNNFKIIKCDPVRYIYITKNKYDVIIINVSEPHTAMLNRFYTLEFYKNIKRILNENGITIFRLSSNPNCFSQQQAELFASLKNTLEKVFKQTIITPGETSCFMSCVSDGILTDDWKILIERAKERNIVTDYVREYYLYADFSRDRFDYITNRLKDYKNTDINTDFKPISYYYDIILWSSHFNFTFIKIFKFIKSNIIYFLFAFLFFLIVFLFTFRDLKTKISFVIATTGFIEMSIQIIVLIVFQILYGYIYYKLSIIFTVFMVGLIIGACVSNKTIESALHINSIISYRLKKFIKIQLFMCINLFFLIFIFFILNKFRRNEIIFFIGDNLVLSFIVPLITGFIGGYQFPLGNALYYSGSQEIIAGRIYGYDLFGSCLGGILISVIFIPVVGIYFSCLILLLLSILSLIYLLI